MITLIQEAYQTQDKESQLDRPDWIPDYITEGWDPSPYAYQTEEEAMPAGGLHGHILAYIAEVLRYPLKKRNLMLLIDVFLLYRHKKGKKKRIGPDLLLMPYRAPPPSAYDLDTEDPPLLVVEVTSPDSRGTDLQKKAPLYLGFGIPIYFVIDAITTSGKPRSQIGLHLWREVDGQPVKISPDPENGLLLPEMGLSVSAQGQTLKFVDAETNEILFDSEQRLTTLEQERRIRTAAEEALKNEIVLRKSLEARLRNLEAKLGDQTE